MNFYLFVNSAGVELGRMQLARDTVAIVVAWRLAAKNPGWCVEIFRIGVLQNQYLGKVILTAEFVAD